MVAINQRIGWLSGIVVVLLVMAVGRATYLGLIRADSLQAAATNEQVTTIPLPAPRGEILDRNGNVLALSESADQVIADPLLIQNPPSGSTPAGKQPMTPYRAARKLSPILHMPVLTLAGIFSRHIGYVTLMKYAPADMAQAAEQAVPNGINLKPDMKRVYPLDTTASQVVGWTATCQNGSCNTGIEGQYNQPLTGVDGVRKVVHDANGVPISDEESRVSRSGKPVRLTIDSSLQNEVEQVLAGVGQQYSPIDATAIVMNPNTGAVLALGNWPSVNANDPYAGYNTAAGRARDNVAVQDHAVAMAYEPGSTFKAITVAGALQDGLITPSTPFDVPPYLDPYGSMIRDAESHGYETLTTADILKVSSNIGADLIGRRLGATRFNYWVHRFGFGAKTGVDLPGEVDGYILSPDKYSGTSMYNLPFGQGESVTPMQMAAAYSAIANGGTLRPPHIVASIGGKAIPTSPGKRIISTQTASELRQMLIGVLGEGGTASGAAIPGYQMAGKTGTAQVAVGGKYSSSAYVASFVGMVPANNPKLVCMVVVDQPNGSIYGGQVAAPAFQKIVGWAVPYFGISPR